MVSLSPETEYVETSVSPFGGIFQTTIILVNREQASLAFDYGLLDFISKPILEKRFKIAVDKLLKILPSQFLSVHRSYIIPKHCISKVFLLTNITMVFNVNHVRGCDLGTHII